MREVQAGNACACVEHDGVPLALGVYGLLARESY